MTTEHVTRIIVNSRYLPIRGMTSDVGGISSLSSKKNTVSASNIEIQRVIFSPESDGKKKTSTERKDIATHGIIRLTV